MTEQGKGLSCKHTWVCICRARAHQQAWRHLHTVHRDTCNTSLYPYFEQTLFHHQALLSMYGCRPDTDT